MNAHHSSWLIAAALLVAAPTGFDARSSAPAAAVPTSAVANRAPLQQGAFQLLPLGAVKPRGWLRGQLEIQAKGLGGHLDEIWPDVGPDSAWRGGSGEGWERGPYFLDGLVPLAYQLDDPRLIAKVKPWVEWTLTNQRADGAIGPPKNTDWWPNMVMLKVLTQYQEATGDPRVIPLMSRYFAHHAAQLDAIPLKEWAIYRWHDELLSVLWLYNRTGDPTLLDFARRLAKQGFDWKQQFAAFRYTGKVAKADTKLDTHVVNNAMALKVSGLWWLVTGDPADRRAAGHQLATMDRYHLLPNGVHSGDEHYAGTNPSQGTELCAVVEGMFSVEQLLGILGDPALGDRLEKMTFNALPGTFDGDMWAHQYDQQPNQVLCSLRPRSWTTNGPESNLFGLEPNYGCCTSNFHQGWPKFVSSLWMATADGGVVAAAYGPSEVTTTVRGGVPVTLTEETEYPFRDQVSIAVSPARAATFPLLLRVPGWAANAEIAVNGQRQASVAAGSFHRIERSWKTGDRVTLRFPMAVRASRWFNESVALERGPLVYSLRVGEEWRKVTAGMRNPARAPAVDWEVHPTSAWNYALAIDPAKAAAAVTVTEKPLGTVPFSPQGAPVELRVPGRRVDGWTMVDGSADAPPKSPVATHGPDETLTLVPYGAAKLRVTAFPVTSPAPAQAQAKVAFRPPAVPLVTHDPYFSIWATGDRLTDRPTTHWTGTTHAMSALARIDGRSFRLMGHQPGDVPALTQRSVTVLPLRTIYVFEGGGVELTLTFLSPMLPHDLELVSRPASYVTFQAKATDGKSHDVALYYDASSQIAVNSPNQPVTWDAKRDGPLERLRVASAAQPVLAKDGDNLRIDWGSFYVAAAKAPGTITRIARDVDAQRSFAATGGLPSADTGDAPRPVDDRTPVLAVTFALGPVGSTPVSRHVVVAYDDEWSVEFLGERARPWWRRNGADAVAMLEAAENDYARLVKASEAYDAALMTDLEKRGGAAFARVAALAFRQTLAAHKLVAHPKTGEALYFSKENFSNGCMGTVDVTYPSSPFFLLFAPKLLAAQLRPVLEYAASPRWRFPFAPHDLGRYPKANGQVYGGGEKTEENQMPVEESGNMLLMLGALATLHDDVALSKEYWPTIARWVAYLESKGFDPENQLSTDDFAGHLAHNTNLSLKAILALAAAGDLAKRLGNDAEAARLRTVTAGMAAKWDETAKEGEHYRLAFDRPGTWSQKYNLVWDTLLGYRLFPDHVRRRELAHYATRQNVYGLPLDNRADYTKADWIVWTATLAETPADFAALIGPIHAFLHETPDRVPFTDWYSTTSGLKRGFQARSVVGGVFIPMLSDRASITRWSAGGGSPAP